MNSSMMGPTGSVGNKIPKGYKSGQMQQFTPEQMQLFQQLFSQVSPDSYLSRLAGGDQSFYDEMEAPALRQFSALQGNIASRFSGGGGGQGALGSRRSSGFQNEMGQLGSNFSQDLQSRRQALQQNAIKELMGLSGDLLGQKPYEQFLVPKKENQTAEMVGRLGGAIPGLISSFMGGGSPGSALKGASSIFGG